VSLLDPAILRVLKGNSLKLERAEPSLESSGLDDLDAILGGLPAQGLVELLGDDGSGTLSLALAFANARAIARSKPVVLVDASGAGLLPTGPWANHTIVVRPPTPHAALSAFDEALRCPAVCAAIVRVQKLPLQKTQRLNHAARLGSSLGILLRPSNDNRPTAAAVRLRVTRQPSRLHELEVEVLRARGLPADGVRFRVNL
jgi:hypothetical protein